MASISPLPCHKCAPAASSPSAACRPGPLLGFGRSRFGLESKGRSLLILKAQAKEVSVDDSSNSVSLKKLENASENGVTVPELASKSSGQVPAALGPAVSAMLAEASRLITLVDLKDITELTLKHEDCELTIRKEALQQPVQSATMQHAHMMSPPQNHVVQALVRPSPTTPAAAPRALPPEKGSDKPALPPLKSPMAGNFYRSPGPGEAPFVKVGDKVQKGQVVCIIEAMKLMNEIEADQSGTVIEILAEDSKPVSVDTPLLVIQP